jgi:anti-sigma B factor antagonist
MPLTAQMKEREPGVFVFTPCGSLDTNTYQILEARVDDVLRHSPRTVVFDMAGLDYISSMGLRVILKTEKNLKQKGGNVVLTNLQPQIEKVFEIVNALPSLTIFKDTNEMDAYLDKMQKKALED